MGYLVVQKEGNGYIIEKKSKFLAEVHAIESIEQIQQAVEAAKKRYFDAKHHCYAYSLGESHETIRAYDDGEPGGTAGRPILDMILHEDIHNILIIVTRYYGGVQLGMGGLSRAYQSSAKDALAHSVLVTQEIGWRIKVVMDYTFLGKAQHIIAGIKVITEQVDYGTQVTMVLVVGVEVLAQFEKQLINESGGQVEIQKVETTTYIL